ncbi:cell wall metabolism sensor histidine kinase WalK [Alicyclobacillus sp. SO9]|uniref:sensor histidine kinase n=1 Tax=Alicyclobacillus sp. SO9 TaxID=2665646 RepID=UPI0018E81C83|nr:ATP-binding protein [Alicyclobacillus sp. SO9]QQE77066.1 sensor histidine kinase [Alicyclobacillus sp. SO9]
MKLRTELLLINVASTLIIVAAVVYSYIQMLLNLKQAGLLTIIAVVAGVLSTLAYWLMTKPIINSVNRLIEFADEEGADMSQGGTPNDAPAKGPVEVRQLTRSVHEMKERMHENVLQLEALERTRRHLVANVSHDLRTPIASIQAFVEALEDGVIDDHETSTRYLNTIHREARRLSLLIDDLFELSKVEAGQQAYDPETGYVDEILVGLLESSSVKLQEKQIRVLVSVEDEVPPLQMMPAKISRVIHNLLDNAIQYAPRQSEIEVTAIFLDETREVEVRIRDEGPGIQSSETEQIFERFYRVDKSRSRNSGGAGLGLAVAKSLVELHGGRIGVRPRNNGSSGSEFWFTLPVSGL